MWNNEASDFTSWLAERENLQNLGDEIGVDICLIRTEAPVGTFFVDILVKNEKSGKHVVIENQLEATDHNHLGKIITYAAGFEASIVIWVVKEAREEHRKAIDWLNQHTDKNVAFLLVKVEVLQIDDSRFAPNFVVISKPNDWAKEIDTNEITDTQALQLKFWQGFIDYVQENGTTLNLKTANPKGWFDIKIKKIKYKNAYITLSLNSIEKVIRTEFYIPDNIDLYSFLEQQKDKIHELLGYEVEWMELPDKKASRVKIEKQGPIDNTDEWKNYFRWLQKEAEQFQRVFGKLVETY